MTNVVNIADFRRRETEHYPTAEELATMPYNAVLNWAGSSFDRLVAVARARDYMPQWVLHQMEEHGRQLTGPQDAIMQRLIANAGPYLSRRQRWIMRQVKAKPMPVSALAELAASAAEYRGYKRPDRCVAHDIAKLVESGMLQTHAGVISDAAASGGAAEASTPR
jgi:hypothetical protein